MLAKLDFVNIMSADYLDSVFENTMPKAPLKRFMLDMLVYKGSSALITSHLYSRNRSREARAASTMPYGLPVIYARCCLEDEDQNRPNLGNARQFRPVLRSVGSRSTTMPDRIFGGPYITVSIQDTIELQDSLISDLHSSKPRQHSDFWNDCWNWTYLIAGTLQTHLIASAAGDLIKRWKT